MEDEQAKKLIEIVAKYMKSEKGNYDGAVDLVAGILAKNSIPPSSLLELCYLCGSNEMYSLAYIFAKTSASLSTGYIKATAHYNMGVASVFMGRLEEAEKQYILL
jgi:hypothetical protein